MTKITKATVKSFIKKNQGKLFISCRSSFDGMTDCVQSTGDNGFKPVEYSDRNPAYTMNISGAWFVGQSRDYFTPYDKDGFVGISVYNSCGTFILAVKKDV